MKTLLKRLRNLATWDWITAEWRIVALAVNPLEAQLITNALLERGMDRAKLAWNLYPFNHPDNGTQGFGLVLAAFATAEEADDLSDLIDNGLNN